MRNGVYGVRKRSIIKWIIEKKLIIKNDTAFGWIKTDIFEVISSEQVSDGDQQQQNIKLDHCPTFIHSHVTAANIWDVVVNAKKQTIYFYSIIISWGTSIRKEKDKEKKRRQKYWIYLLRRIVLSIKRICNRKNN